jgi:hypothetical protein
MESSTAKGFADIPKLSDAKTYEIWRLVVDDLLRRHKVKRCVEGKSPAMVRPTQSSEALLANQFKSPSRIRRPQPRCRHT